MTSTSSEQLPSLELINQALRPHFCDVQKSWHINARRLRKGNVHLSFMMLDNPARLTQGTIYLTDTQAIVDTRQIIEQHPTPVVEQVVDRLLDCLQKGTAFIEGAFTDGKNIVFATNEVAEKLRSGKILFQNGQGDLKAFSDIAVVTAQELGIFVQRNQLFFKQLSSAPKEAPAETAPEEPAKEIESQAAKEHAAESEEKEPEEKEIASQAEPATPETEKPATEEKAKAPKAKKAETKLPEPEKPEPEIDAQNAAEPEVPKQAREGKAKAPKTKKAEAKLPTPKEPEPEIDTQNAAEPEEDEIEAEPEADEQDAPPEEQEETELQDAK